VCRVCRILRTNVHASKKDHCVRGAVKPTTSINGKRRCKDFINCEFYFYGEEGGGCANSECNCTEPSSPAAVIEKSELGRCQQSVRIVVKWREDCDALVDSCSCNEGPVLARSVLLSLLQSPLRHWSALALAYWSSGW
jgi:hypothetical protein